MKKNNSKIGGFSTIPFSLAMGALGFVAIVSGAITYSNRTIIAPSNGRTAEMKKMYAESGDPTRVALADQLTPAPALTVNDFVPATTGENK